MVPCPCGDQAHASLKQWYHETNPWRGDDDKFDKAEGLLPSMSSYCPNCQGLIQKLQDIGPMNHSYHEPHFNTTLRLGIGYTQGCHQAQNQMRCSGMTTYLSMTLRYHSWNPDSLALSLLFKSGPG